MLITFMALLGSCTSVLWHVASVLDSSGASRAPFQLDILNSASVDDIFATWFTFRNFGNIIGGAISLGINHKVNHKGKVGYQTYLGFLAIQCLGFFSGLLLSNPEKVQRDDGTRIQAPRGIHWRTEGKEMWRLVTSKSILLLMPLFWYFGWIQAYPGTYFATYFTVRSRALGSFLSAVVMTFSTWIGGTLVDLPWSKSRQRRALTTYALIASLNSATWIWAVYI
jgi:hypothetical protein